MFGLNLLFYTSLCVRLCVEPVEHGIHDHSSLAVFAAFKSRYMANLFSLILSLKELKKIVGRTDFSDQFRKVLQ